MNEQLSVMASIYKVTQNRDDMQLTFYAYNQPEKNIDADHRYSMPELFDVLLDCAAEYQRERSNENG